MDKERILYAIAESCPFDALLVRDMKRSINSLLQLNLRRFRLPQKEGTKYSALDVMKQALELVFEFSPSERNYEHPTIGTTKMIPTERYQSRSKWFIGLRMLT